VGGYIRIHVVTFDTFQ